MKYINAIYASESNARKLWLIIAWLFIITSLLFSSTLYLIFRDPLIIERSCESKIITSGSSTHTKSEIETFIKEALAARFNSERDKPSLMTEAQVEVKRKELKELEAKNITQTVFIDQLELHKNGEFKSKLTRLLKIGNLSTALGFEIEAKLFEIKRTEDNPYGLILSEVKLIQNGEK